MISKLFRCFVIGLLPLAVLTSCSSSSKKAASGTLIVTNSYSMTSAGCVGSAVVKAGEAVMFRPDDGLPITLGQLGNGEQAPFSTGKNHQACLFTFSTAGVGHQAGQFFVARENVGRTSGSGSQALSFSVSG